MEVRDNKEEHAEVEEEEDNIEAEEISCPSPLAVTTLLSFLSLNECSFEENE